MSYGKIHGSIFTGSLYGEFEATVTLIACVVLSDKDGHLGYTSAALAGATGFPLSVIQIGLKKLSEPDVTSRSEECEGRRVIQIIEGIDNGYRVVNKAKYRDLLSQEDRAEYMRDYMRTYRKHGKQSVNTGNSDLTQLGHTDTDTDTNKDIYGRTPSASDRFDVFWRAYPKKVKKRPSRLKWRAKQLDTKVDELLADIQMRLKEDGRWRAGFIPDPLTYLTQERWNDEVSEARA